ncbi:MAG: DUF3500 domain-containing protein [Acidobacteriota bacterium]|nr:DUF3500 domain-containing protein [Acidobacteriota bacterium]
MRRLLLAVLFLTIGLALVARVDDDPTNRTIRFPRPLLASSLPGVGIAAQEPIEPAAADATTEAVVAAAEALLADLDAAQAATAQFDFSDDEQRANWSNLPTGIFERKGVRMGDLTPWQRASVHDVLRSTLSEFGFRQVMENVSGDEVLKQSGSPGRVVFGQDEYYFSFLGTPSTDMPWMWQFGDHHLAINATIFGGNIVLTPSLTGGQPMTYPQNGETVNQLASEYDQAFALIRALDSDQQDVAIMDASYVDLTWGPTQDGSVTTPLGIRGDALTAPQKTHLLGLIGQRVNLLNETNAAAKMVEVESNIDNTYFAWYGQTLRGGAVYYRVHGPTVWIEHAPQALGGSPTNHIHAIYRDPTNDYAVGLLAALEMH